MFGMGGDFDRNNTFQNCWTNLPFGFKTFFVSGLVLSILQVFTSTITYYLASLPLLTILYFQIWRLFVSMYMSIGVNGFINFLIIFLWFLDIWPNMKYSSLFIIVDVFLHNLAIQILFTLIVGIYGLGLNGSTATIFNGGWGTLLLVYLFKQSAVDPNTNVKFCCFPCLLPRKYIPWIMLAFGIIFSSEFGSVLSYICAAFIGYFEAFYFKTNIIRLPFGFYAKLQNLLPYGITQRPDYIKVSAVAQQLKPLTYKCCSDNDQVENGNIGVHIIRGGVAIGGNIPQNQVNIRQINIKRLEGNNNHQQIQPHQNFYQEQRPQVPLNPKKNNGKNSLLNQNEDLLNSSNDTKLSENGLIAFDDVIDSK